MDSRLLRSGEVPKDQTQKGQKKDQKNPQDLGANGSLALDDLDDGPNVRYQDEQSDQALHEVLLMREFGII